MSVEHISEFPPPDRRALKEKRAPAKNMFPSEEPFEESVSESKRHLEARTTLYLVLRKAYQSNLSPNDDPDRKNMGIGAKGAEGDPKPQMVKVAIGSEQFVYYDANDGTKCFSPDVFVKLDSDAQDFPTWLVAERGVPDLVVEIVSDSDRENSTWDEKLAKYQACGVREVVRFDELAKAPITIWDRMGTTLIERTRNRLTSYECRTLGLYWTIEKDPTYGPQLRLAKDPGGKELLPTPDENEVRIEQLWADERRTSARLLHEKILAEQKTQQEAQARALAEQKQHEEAQARALAEQKQHEEAHARALAEQKTQQEAHARALAEQKQREEATARVLAEKRTQEEATARVLAEKRTQEESTARALAEQKQHEEAHARALAEKRTQEEATARALAEKKQRKEAKARREEAKARTLAEQKQREEAQLRARAETEVAQLRAELERLHKASRKDVR